LIRELRSFAGSSIVAGLFSRPEIIILSLVRSPTQVGLYAAAFKVVDLWQIIPVTYMFNVFPVLSRSYHVADKQWQRIQDKSIRFLLAASLPLAAGIAATAGPLVRLLFGPGFDQTVPLLRIMALYIPLVSLNSVYWRVLSARGQQHVVLKVQTFTTAVRLGGGYGLIVWLGPLGATLSGVGIILVHNWLLSRQIKSDGTQIPLLHLSWRLAAAALGMGAFTYALRRELAMPLWELVPLAGASYLILVVLFRAFSQDDISLLRSIWQPEPASRGEPHGRG
jgi:O-antigen/teichoic acid export membrane protein